MPSVFICYRREDSGAHAGRIYDHLAAHFAAHRVFMDIDTVDLGDDFVRAVEDRVSSCDALIAIIGDQWVNSTDSDGKRRLDDPNDFVRLEIATALRRGVRVIPVLVDGAAMPSAVDLPDNVAALVRRNALELNHVGFRHQIGRLIEALERTQAPPFPLDTISGAPANEPDEPERTRAAGERRQLTIVVCELVTTDLTSGMDPEEWRDVAERYLETAAEVLTRFDGHVARSLGNGLLVYFGWPKAHGTDAECAVRAALGVVHAIADLNAASFAIRVGIDTGAVVVADDGQAYGDVPNIATRVQEMAEPGSVLITAATQHLVAGLFVVEERAACVLRGLRRPMTLYQVRQPSGVRSRLEMAAGHLTPFVGRQSELGVLADAWERAAEGMGQTVLVLGEAGIGKSRLIYQLRERLVDAPHTWLECPCDPYPTATAFRPVIELVEQVIFVRRTDSPADKLAMVIQAVHRTGLGDETIALFAEFLSLPESAGYAPLQMSPDLKRRRTLQTLAAWLLKLAELQPLVMLIEDLHWCDPSSLELFGKVVEQSATARVFLVGTARPEFQTPWPARSNLKTVTLERLTKRQAREMVLATCTVRALPESVIDQLVARADGVPLYAEELTRAVVENESDATSVAIPATLQDSLLARLDRLASAKEVAQRAAVLGREFPYLLLAASSGLDEKTLDEGLARLVDAELVFARGEPPTATYRFKHALIQEAAYHSLLKSTREALHARVAHALEERFPVRAAEEPEVLARHYDAANMREPAGTYYERAATQAAARSAHNEAVVHLQRALTLLAMSRECPERNAHEAVLQLDLGASLIVVRGFAHSDTLAAYERARALSEPVAEGSHLGAALFALTIYYAGRAELDQALTLAKRLLQIGEKHDDEASICVGHVSIAIPECYRGHFAASLEHCEHALNIYKPSLRNTLVCTTGADQGVAAMGWSAWNLANLGYTDRARARARQAVELARTLAHPFSVGFALAYGVPIYWFLRDVDSTRHLSQEIIALSEAQGFPLWLGVGKVFHGAALAASGAGDTAIAEVMDGFTLLADTGNEVGAPALITLLAEVYQLLGRTTEALSTVDTALSVATQTGQPFFDAVLHRLKGDLIIQSEAGDPTEIEHIFRRALDIARSQEAKAFELRAAISLAHFLRGQGRSVEARDLLAPIDAWFTEGFDTRDLIEARALLNTLPSLA